MFSLNPLGYSSRGAAIGRRQFLGTAAGVIAALPSRRLWADTPATAAAPASLVAVGTAGKPVTLSASDIADFRKSLRGQLLLAQDASYEQARKIWNGAFDRHPALIARCEGAADVVQAVGFARSHALLCSVKGGGHSLSGQSACDGGLMIDLTPMKQIDLDRARRRASVQPGVLLGELDSATQAAGLVTPLGTASDTGIAGLTLGGGQGRLMRSLGLSCDNVRAYEIVTADGTRRTASTDENPDLYWGLRGGGGNFGVVTRFDYELHPLDHLVLAGNLFFPFSQARTVLAGLAEFAEHAPDELYLSSGLVNIAPSPANTAPGAAVPPGRYAVIEAVYSGQPADGEKVLAPLSRLGKPAAGKFTAKRYVEAQNGLTGASPPALPAGLGVYVKSGFLSKDPQAVLDGIVNGFEHGPEWLDSIGLGLCAGAVARVRPEATAYWNRGAKWDLLLAGAWFDHSQDQHNTAVLRDLWKTFEPYTKGYYVNTEPSAEEQRLRETYGDNYARLVQLKTKYDPNNLFHLNANIKPSAAA